MGTKQYDNALDLITFSRASNGTSLRKISYGSELVTNGTFDTDTDWTKSAGWTITGGAAAHDGTGGGEQIDQAGALIAGRVYILNFDLAVTSGSGVAFRSTKSSGTGQIQFNSSGSYELVFVSGDGGVTFAALASFVGTIDNISVKEVLFDQPDGTLTLFNHPDNIPRIDYNADGTVKGLLIEEQRTNLVTYSQDFTDASWVKTSLSVTANSVTSPDGDLTANTLTSSGSGTNRIRFSVSLSGVNSYSVYAKAGTGSYLQIIDSSSGFYYANFDLSLGVVGTKGSRVESLIEDGGNGWYRCTMVTDGSISGLDHNIYIVDSASANYGGSSSSADTIYIWGAQLEAGAFPTSYIPTSGASATREPDLASIPVTDFGYNQKAGTVVVEYNYVAVNSGLLGRFLELSGTSAATERILLYANYGTSNGYFQIRDNGADSVALQNSNTPFDDWNVAAAAYKTNSANLCTNGTLSADDLSVVVPDDITTLDIGSASSTRADLGKVYIRSVKYYPRRLTNTQLQELTA